MKNELNNLIIHPKDNSTTFLKPIYKQASNQNVIEQNSSPDELISQMTKNDRIMMMGHGSPKGLFSIKLFQDQWHNSSAPFKWMAIDRNDVELLKDKPENIYICCNADKLVEHYEIGRAHV